MVKSPAGYRTGHFPEIRPDTGPDLLSGTPLLVKIFPYRTTSSFFSAATFTSFFSAEKDTINLENFNYFMHGSVWNARMSWFLAWNRMEFSRSYGSMHGNAWKPHELGSG